MAKQDYNSLEEQIGDMGGDSQNAIGKLKYKESYGGKTELSEEENSELESFLDRSRKHRNIEPTEEIRIGNGWIPVDKSEMGIRANYYPENWEFFIRPATVQAIKNWTAIDEERPDIIVNVFNEIIKTCVKIDSHSGTTVSWNQIKSWDRFWFILKVREYTYSTGQTSIEFQDECSECSEEIDYKLTSAGLFYEFPDQELVDKYWDGKAWQINPREYDVDYAPITLYTPTIASEMAIIDWGTAKLRSGGKYDETFINFLLWMLPNPSKDVQMLDRQISQIYKEYKKWSIDMFSFMSDVIRNITINQSEKLRVKCPHCGQEATSTVQFPNGIKVLFEVKTSAKKFGSR